MIVKAYYGLKRGGSGTRPIHSEAEAQKILKGGYGVTNVRLETPNGGIVGLRWKEEYKGRWMWFYDPMYFQ